MNPNVLSVLPKAMADAKDGIVSAVAVVAAIFEVVDRAEDAEELYRLAAHLGSRRAAEHLATLRAQRDEPGGVLEQALELDQERLSPLVDHDALDRFMVEIRKIPVCEYHRRMEPSQPGDYKACDECRHVWRTKAEFVADVRAMERELEEGRARGWDEPGPDLGPQLVELMALVSPAPFVVLGPGAFDGQPVAGRDPEDLPFCPLCSHSW